MRLAEFETDFALLFGGALVLMLLAGSPMIAWLRAKRWRKGTTQSETWAVREDTPDTHQAKQGTPSMGGLGIIGVTLFTFGTFGGIWIGRSYLLDGSAPDFQLIIVFALLPVMVAAHALLGFSDDWSKATGRGGLRALAKLMVQVALAVAFVLIYLPYNGNRTQSIFWIEAGRNDALMLTAIAILAFAIVASGNAVNLTDGIDGLATGLAVQCGLIFAVMDSTFTHDIDLYNRWLWAALAGACLGFLFFNKYPARIFMGDTGSLAIGAALGAGAVLTHSIFLLPFIGFIFFVEMFSVIIQVLYFKWTKKTRGEGQRIFRRAPLHHHFELGGWSERRVVGTFWLVNAVTSLIGLVLWNMELLPRWP